MMKRPCASRLIVLLAAACLAFPVAAQAYGGGGNDGPSSAPDETTDRPPGLDPIISSWLNWNEPQTTFPAGFGVLVSPLPEPSTGLPAVGVTEDTESVGTGDDTGSEADSGIDENTGLPQFEQFPGNEDEGEETGDAGTDADEQSAEQGQEGAGETGEPPKSTGSPLSLSDLIALDQEARDRKNNPPVKTVQVQTIDPHIPMMPGPPPDQTERDVRMDVNAWMATLPPEDRDNLKNNYNPREQQQIKYIRQFNAMIQQQTDPGIRHSWEQHAQQQIERFNATVKNNRTRVRNNIRQANQNMTQIRDTVAGLSLNVFTGPLGWPGVAVNVGVNTAVDGGRGFRSSGTSAGIRGAIKAGVKAYGGKTAQAIDALSAPVVDALTQEAAARADDKINGK